MQKTLTGLVWFIALLAACVVPRMASADDLMECVYRGKFAASMTFAVTEGYALDKINVRFGLPPKNQTEKTEMDRYVESVRKEVGALLDGQTIPEKDQEFAALIGTKVAQACAFEYGKKHGYMRDVNLIDNDAPMEAHSTRELRRIGVTPPLGEREITDGTSIVAPPIGMHQVCNTLRFDINVIGRAISEGKPEEELAAFAKRSLPQLGQERLDRILTLIAEAYAWKGPFVDWMNKSYAECAGNR